MTTIACAAARKSRITFRGACDHHTASAGGVALSRRCAENNAGTDFEHDLVWLAAAIADDQRSLEDVMVWLGVSPSPIRLTIARVGEVAGETFI